MKTSIEKAFLAISNQPSQKVESLVVRSSHEFLSALVTLNISYDGTPIVENPMSKPGIVHFMSRGMLLGSLVFDRETYEK